MRFGCVKTGFDSRRPDERSEEDRSRQTALPASGIKDRSVMQSVDYIARGGLRADRVTDEKELAGDSRRPDC